MSQNLLRVRDGQGASVSFSELLFDLIYVFAVTQLSHYLLHHLTLTGALETLLLWFAVWLAWQYTAWVTNWFNPDTRQIRLLLFAIMLLGLFAAAALPQAFGERGLIFALFYVAIQVGRSVTVLRLLAPGHPLKRNFHRILGGCASLPSSGSPVGWRKATPAWRCGRSRSCANTSRRCSASGCRCWGARTAAANGPSRVTIWRNAASCS